MTNFRQYIEENHDAITQALMEADRNAYRFPTWGQEVYLLRSRSTGEIRLAARDCLDEEDCGTYPEGHDALRLYTVFSPFGHILWDYWFDNFGQTIAAAEEHFGVTFPRDREGDFLDEDGDWFDAGLRETLSICCRAAGVKPAALEDWLDEQTEEAIEYAVSEAVEDGSYEEIIRQAMEGPEAARPSEEI